jgi:hypothetical protein
MVSGRRIIPRSRGFQPTRPYSLPRNESIITRSSVEVSTRQWPVIDDRKQTASQTRRGDPRWVAFERPQVVTQYYDGRSGDLLYAEAISVAR